MQGLTLRVFPLMVGCEQGARSDSPSGVTSRAVLPLKAVDVPFSGAVTAGLRSVAKPQDCPTARTSVNDPTGTSLHMGRITDHAGGDFPVARSVGVGGNHPLLIRVGVLNRGARLY